MSRREPVPQAAAIPYRVPALGSVEVLLITRRGGGWGLPKGRVEAGEAPRETAARETVEEAGLLGAVDPEPLGRFKYRKRGRRHEVEVFAIRTSRLLARWPEEGRRLRVWVPVREAQRLLRSRSLAPLLDRLQRRLALAHSSVWARAA